MGGSQNSKLVVQRHTNVSSSTLFRLLAIPVLSCVPFTLFWIYKEYSPSWKNLHSSSRKITSPIILVVDSKNDEDLFHEILESEIPETKTIIVGFDTEWGRDSDCVSVIQLAFPSGKTLVIKASPGPVAPSLKAILDHQRVYKVGVALRGDLRRLHLGHGVDVAPCIDLQDLIKIAIPPNNDPIRESLSLRTITYFLTGYLLEKDDSVRCGNWDAKQLNSRQLNYAALDAYCARECLIKLWNYATTIDERKTSGIESWLKSITNHNFGRGGGGGGRNNNKKKKHRVRSSNSSTTSNLEDDKHLNHQHHHHQQQQQQHKVLHRRVSNTSLVTTRTTTSSMMSTTREQLDDIEIIHLEEEEEEEEKDRIYNKMQESLLGIERAKRCNLLQLEPMEYPLCVVSNPRVVPGIKIQCSSYAVAKNKGRRKKRKGSSTKYQRKSGLMKDDRVTKKNTMNALLLLPSSSSPPPPRLDQCLEEFSTGIPKWVMTMMTMTTTSTLKEEEEQQKKQQQQQQQQGEMKGGKAKEKRKDKGKIGKGLLASEINCAGSTTKPISHYSAAARSSSSTKAISHYSAAARSSSSTKEADDVSTLSSSSLELSSNLPSSSSSLSSSLSSSSSSSSSKIDYLPRYLLDHKEWRSPYYWKSLKATEHLIRLEFPTPLTICGYALRATANSSCYREAPQRWRFEVLHGQQQGEEGKEGEKKKRSHSNEWQCIDYVSNFDKWSYSSPQLGLHPNQVPGDYRSFSFVEPQKNVSQVQIRILPPLIPFMNETTGKERTSSSPAASPFVTSLSSFIVIGRITKTTSNHLFSARKYGHGHHGGLQHGDLLDENNNDIRDDRSPLRRRQRHRDHSIYYNTKKLRVFGGRSRYNVAERVNFNSQDFSRFIRVMSESLGGRNNQCYMPQRVLGDAWTRDETFRMGLRKLHWIAIQFPCRVRITNYSIRTRPDEQAGATGPRSWFLQGGGGDDDDDSPTTKSWGHHRNHYHTPPWTLLHSEKDAKKWRYPGKVRDEVPGEIRDFDISKSSGQYNIYRWVFVRGFTKEKFRLSISQLRLQGFTYNQECCIIECLDIYLGEEAKHRHHAEEEASSSEVIAHNTPYCCEDDDSADENSIEGDHTSLITGSTTTTRMTTPIIGGAVNDIVRRDHDDSLDSEIIGKTTSEVRTEDETSNDVNEPQHYDNHLASSLRELSTTTCHNIDDLKRPVGEVPSQSEFDSLSHLVLTYI